MKEKHIKGKETLLSDSLKCIDGMSSTESYKLFIYSKIFIEHCWGPRTVLHAGDMMVSKIDMCHALLEFFVIFFIDKRMNKDNKYTCRIFSWDIACINNSSLNKKPTEQNFHWIHSQSVYNNKYRVWIVGLKFSAYA